MYNMNSLCVNHITLCDTIFRPFHAVVNVAIKYSNIIYEFYTKIYRQNGIYVV